MSKIQELKTAFASHPIRLPYKRNVGVVTVFVDEINQHYSIHRRIIRDGRSSNAKCYFSSTRRGILSLCLRRFMARHPNWYKDQEVYVEFELNFDHKELHKHFAGWTKFSEVIQMKTNSVRDMTAQYSDVFKCTDRLTGTVYFASSIIEEDDRLAPNRIAREQRVVNNSRTSILSRYKKKFPEIHAFLMKNLTSSYKDWIVEMHDAKVSSSETQSYVRELNRVQEDINTLALISQL